MDLALKSQFVPVLRKRGFKGRYPHFTRITEGKVDILGIQFSQWGDQFYLEIGIGPREGVNLSSGKLIEGDKLKHYHIVERRRVGDLSYDYSNIDPVDVANKVIRCIESIEEWFADSNRESILTTLRANRVAGEVFLPSPQTTGQTGPYPAVPDGSDE